MEKSRKEYQEVENLIKNEIGLYTRYLKLIEEERQHVVASKTDKIFLLSAERQGLVEKMQQAQDERRRYLRQFSADRLLKLSTFVKSFFTPAEASRLMPQVEALRKLVMQAQAGSGEFSQVIGFSLTLVSGLVSILWSATQNIVRSYNACGKLQEAYHPAGFRHAGVLRQA